jgi:hypothetical protein
MMRSNVIVYKNNRLITTGVNGDRSAQHGFRNAGYIHFAPDVGDGIA